MDRPFAQENAGNVNGWAVWKLSGALDNNTSDTAYEMGLSIIRENEKTVIDMSDMDYLSSAGIRALLKICKQAEKMSRKLVAAGATGLVRSVLEDSRMSVMLDLKYSMDALENTAE